jgi:TIR domain-containing protein
MEGKPTLFLSHASTDGESLKKLREILSARAVGSLEIFLSSDGQSIPFGRNWVHEIEEALKRAKLMFVFVSPAALQSSWIPFESGFAYACGIRVVPVGIAGVDLSALRPPLSLLQGFNLFSAPALNNLIATINEVFELRLPENLGEEEFARTFLHDSTTSRTALGRHSSLVLEIVFHTPCVHEAESGAVQRFFEESHFECHVEQRKLYSSGLELPLHKGSIDIRLDASLTAITLPLVEKLVPFLAGSEFPGQFSFELKLPGAVRAVEAMHKLSARVFGTEMALAPDGRLKLGDLFVKLRQHHTYTGAFRMPGPFNTTYTTTRPSGSELDCQFASPELTTAPLADALEILFSCGALQLEEA